MNCRPSSYSFTSLPSLIDFYHPVNFQRDADMISVFKHSIRIAYTQKQKIHFELINTIQQSAFTRASLLLIIFLYTKMQHKKVHNTRFGICWLQHFFLLLYIVFKLQLSELRFSFFYMLLLANIFTFFSAIWYIYSYQHMKHLTRSVCYSKTSRNLTFHLYYER